MKKLSASLALLLLMNALMNSSAISAQTEKGIIRGKVIDKETQSTLPDAVIELIETKKKTGSNENGEFVFENLKPAAYRIKVSYIGYETSLKTDLVLTGDRPLDIIVELNPSSYSTEEIDISANYFEKNSHTNTSSVNLDYEEIRRAPGAAEDISRMIQTISGVSFSNDQRNDLIIRGGSPSENLFVIDGIEIPNINHFGSQGGNRHGTHVDPVGR